MKLRVIILSFIGYFTFCALHAQTPWQAVVGTDLAFAKQALSSSAKEAFLTYLSDSGQVYNKGMLVLGKPYWQSQPSTGQIAWGPEFAIVSSAGDMGVTTGPWYKDNSGERVSQGYYNNIWRRRPDGTFALWIDLGIEYTSNNNQLPLRASAPVIATQASTATRADVLELDASLAKAIRRKGPNNAYVDIMSEEVRLFRPGRSPLVEKNWIISYLAKEARYEFEPTSSFMSKSGDLGYVVGKLSGKNKGVYMRVWKNEVGFGWRLATEVYNYE